MRMRHALYLIVLLATAALAEGPKYQHKDGNVNMEFQNVYQDIRSKIPIYSSTTYVSSTTASSTYLTLSSAAATYLNVSSAAAIVVTAAGEIRQQFQPSFLATNGTGANDVTGDGTLYTVPWPTEIYDQGSDFASNTFTAPVTGRYLLTFNAMMSGLGASHANKIWRITTSNRQYNSSYGTAISGQSYLSGFVSVIADMDANDTATCLIYADGSTKIVDLNANAEYVVFSGSLIN